MAADLTPELVRLLDERDITAALHRYTNGADRRDIEEMRTAYHPDAADVRGSDGTAATFLDGLLEKVAHFDRMMHCLSNIEIRIDGDSAKVTSYMRAFRLMTDDDGNTVILEGNGSYLDRFEKREGEWRIASRDIAPVWNERRTITDS